MSIQRIANHTKAENRIRSATEPATSATVMIAKVIWYIMNSISGMVLAAECTVSMPMPRRNSRSRLPRIVPSLPKASE